MKKNDIYFTIKKVTVNGYKRYRIQKMIEGKTIQVTGKTKKEVTEKFYKKLELEQNNKNEYNMDIDKILFYDFAYFYLNEILIGTNAIKHNTIQSYRNTCETHIKNGNIGRIKLVDLRTHHFQQFFNNLSKKLKVSSMKQVKIFVSSVMNYAVKNDFIVKNYCSNIIFKQEQDEPKNKFISDNEIKMILNNCQDEQLRMIIILILNSGLRIGEALALNVCDVLGGNINVNKTTLVRNGCVVCDTPKTKNSNRQIPMNPNIQLALDKYMNWLKQKYMKTGVPFSNQVILFPNNRMKYYRESIIIYKLNNLYIVCDLDYKGSHVLRHTFGSKLYEAGADLKIISELLGHANINMTASVYIHISEKTKMEALQLISM